MLDILLLIVGLILILIGANYLIDGASAVAKRWGLSEFVIGMTIVGIGTSAPEMVVSFISAIKGNADIAVGNIVGSNIFNNLMILGVSAIIYPLSLTGNNLKKDIPFCLLAVITFIFATSDIFFDGAADNILSRTDGLFLLSLYAVFMAYTIFSAQSGSPSELESGAAVGEKVETEKNVKVKPLWLSAIMIVGGLAGLVFGGEMFVKSATAIANMLNVSDAVIAVTILAGGSSLPELASCVVAAYKKNAELALGNVIGSNVSNIFMILGGSAVIHPLKMGNITSVDLGVLLISTLLLFVTAFTFKKRQLDRYEGFIFIAIYIGYVIWLIK